MPDKDLAEVGKEIVNQVAKPVQDFIGAVAEKPGEELGLWIADGIRGKRLETQIKIYTKAQKLVSEAGIPARAVNLKTLLPLIEKGSLEDEEDLVDMWAHLLANASMSDGTRASYVSILGELEPTEARIMQYIYNQFIQKYGEDFQPTNEYAGSMSGELIRNAFQLDGSEFEQAIDNLYRLRLLAPSASRLDFLDNKETPFAHYTKKQVGVTYLGYYFARACNQSIASEAENKNV